MTKKRNFPGLDPTGSRWFASILCPCFIVLLGTNFRTDRRETKVQNLDSVLPQLGPVIVSASPRRRPTVYTPSFQSLFPEKLFLCQNSTSRNENVETVRSHGQLSRSALTVRSHGQLSQSDSLIPKNQTETR